MNLNRRVPNGLPGGVRGRKFYYFLLLDFTLRTAVCMSVNALYKANLYILIFRFKMYYFALHLTHSELKYK